MKKRSILFSFLTVLLCASCQEELPYNELDTSSVYYATMENMSSKTVLDENNNVLWSQNDCIAIFPDRTLPDEYQVMEQYVGQNNGGFTLKSSPVDGGGFVSYTDIQGNNIAFYPYNKFLGCLKGDAADIPSSYLITGVNIPERQVYQSGSFGNGAFPMVAITKTNALQFKNLAGLVKLQLTGTDVIKEIVFEGNGNEIIAGDAKARTYVKGDVPQLMMTGKADKSFKTITLDCGAGVQLSDVPTVFTFSVPPTVFEKGFKFTIKDVNGGVMVQSSSKRKVVERSVASKMPNITFEKETLEVESQSTIEADPQGETVSIPVKTNLGYVVTIPQDAQSWVSQVVTKAIHTDYLRFQVAENMTGVDRQTVITFTSNDNSISSEVILKQSSIQVIEISNLQELKAFRDNVNQKKNNYKNCIVKLTADIKLNNPDDPWATTEYWKPISNFNASIDTDENKFQGTFDGQNHVISGLQGNRSVFTQCYGFFGSVNNATIKNLTVKGAMMDRQLSYGDYANVGGIVGWATGNTRIINCTNECNISDIYNKYAFGSVGGIVGTMDRYVTIENCTNRGSLKGRYDVGGICGLTSGMPEIRNCRNEGRLGCSEDSDNGGQSRGTARIWGIMQNGYLYNCVNTAYIAAENGEGYGIGGKIAYGCENSGDVTGEGGCYGIGASEICIGCKNSGRVTTYEHSAAISANIAVACINTGERRIDARNYWQYTLAEKAYACYHQEQRDLNKYSGRLLTNSVFNCGNYTYSYFPTSDNNVMVKTEAEANQYIEHLNKGIEEWNGFKTTTAEQMCHYRFKAGISGPELVSVE